MLASAGVGVEFEATGADLVEALAVVSLEAVVEANWALAVLRQASAFSGVPVVALSAWLVRSAQAAASMGVEVGSSSARGVGIFNTFA